MKRQLQINRDVLYLRGFYFAHFNPSVLCLYLSQIRWTESLRKNITDPFILDKWEVFLLVFYLSILDFLLPFISQL